MILMLNSHAPSTSRQPPSTDQALAEAGRFADELIALEEPPSSWRRDAACTGSAPVDGNLESHPWFPVRGGATAKAVATCRRCPVREACLTSALVRREQHGIHGGAGEAARRVLLRAHAAGVLDVVLADHWARLDSVPGVRRANANGAGATHGRPGTYAKGCRCGACELAVGAREVAASMARGVAA